MRLYVEVAKRAFQRHLAYRAANVAGLMTNAFFGALRAFVFLGLYEGRGLEAGWSVRDAIDYVWLTQALIMPLYLWGWWDIARTIQSGDVVSDLSKPFDYYGFWLSQDAGRAVYHTLFRGAPTLVIGSVLFGAVLPADAGRWSWFLLSLALAIWISFGLRFIVNVLAFWLLDYRGVGLMVMFLGTFLSGFLVPLNFWPDWARATVAWLPFAGMVEAPVSIFLGKATGMDLMAALGHQALWVATLLLAGRLLLLAAERKVVTQGG